MDTIKGGNFEQLKNALLTSPTSEGRGRIYRLANRVGRESKAEPFSRLSSSSSTSSSSSFFLPLSYSGVPAKLFRAALEI